MATILSKALSVALGVLCLAGFAFGEASSSPLPPLVLHPGTVIYRTPPLAFYEEPAGRPQPLAEVMQPGRFSAATTALRKFGYTTAGVWVRLAVRNEAEAASWRLAFDDTTFNRVDVYITDGEQVLRHAVGGSFVPLTERDVQARYPAFTLTAPPGASRVIYARITSFNIIDPSLGLYSPEALAQRDASDDAVLAWYYGAACALLLFNALLFVSLRDKSYLYYCAFVCMLSFTFFTFDGLSDVYLSGLLDGWQRYITTIGNLALVAALLFARVFLNLKARSPRVDRGLFVLALANGAAALFALTHWTVESSNLFDVLLLLTGAVLLGAAVWSRHGGFRPASFYLLSWAALYGMTFVWMGMLYGYLPRNVVTANGILVGAVVEMILMSFGLGDRLKVNNFERLKAREAAREGAAVASAAQMLAHDLKKPYSLLDGLLTAMATEPDAARVQALATKRIPAVRQALSYTQTMLDELQRIGAPAKLQTADVDLVPVCLGALEQVAAAASPGTEISLRFDLQHRRTARIDATLVTRLLVNLLENAVQAIGSRGALWIATKDGRDAGGARLSVRVGNDGPAIAPEHLGQLFDAFFTKGKRGGTGLGLAVCRKIVREHGGELTCTSSEAAGTEFVFTLPAGQKAPARVPALPDRLPVPALALSVVPPPRTLTGAVAPPPDLPRTGAPATSANMTGRIVAVVDDCPFVRETWELGVPDAAVAVFAKPAAFLRRLHTDAAFRARLALVVTDYNFGGDDEEMDGGDLVRCLGRLAAPVVLSSDHGELAPDAARLFPVRVAKRPHSLAELLRLSASLASESRAPS